MPAKRLSADALFDALNKIIDKGKDSETYYTGPAEEDDISKNKYPDNDLRQAMIIYMSPDRIVQAKKGQETYVFHPPRPQIFALFIRKHADKSPLGIQARHSGRRIERGTGGGEA